MSSSAPTSSIPAASRAVVNCPACDCPDCEQVGLAAGAFDSNEGGKVFCQPSYEVRHCAQCGLYFKSRTMVLDDLGLYYAKLESETFERGGNFPTDRLVRGMFKGLPDGTKVLDFGCSTGRVLLGFTGRLDCFGVEYNETAADIARGRGIRIVSEERLRAGEPRDFGAILLADVYEHLPQPVELVEALAELLKPGGVLVIVTGNADAIRARDRIGEYWYFRIPGHLHMASARHLEWLAGRLNLRVEALDLCSHYDTPPMVRLRQYVQNFAYERFRRSPRGVVAALLRHIPLLNRAERWDSAPALTCTRDHAVAIFRKDLACNPS